MLIETEQASRPFLISASLCVFENVLPLSTFSTVVGVLLRPLNLSSHRFGLLDDDSRSFLCGCSPCCPESSCFFPYSLLKIVVPGGVSEMLDFALPCLSYTSYQSKLETPSSFSSWGLTCALSPQLLIVLCLAAAPCEFIPSARLLLQSGYQAPPSIPILSVSRTVCWPVSLLSQGWAFGWCNFNYRDCVWLL